MTGLFPLLTLRRNKLNFFSLAFSVNAHLPTGSARLTPSKHKCSIAFAQMSSHCGGMTRVASLLSYRHTLKNVSEWTFKKTSDSALSNRSNSQTVWVEPSRICDRWRSWSFASLRIKQLAQATLCNCKKKNKLNLLYSSFFLNWAKAKSNSWIYRSTKVDESWGPQPNRFLKHQKLRWLQWNANYRSSKGRAEQKLITIAVQCYLQGSSTTNPCRICVVESSRGLTGEVEGTKWQEKAPGFNVVASRKPFRCFASPASFPLLVIRCIIVKKNGNCTKKEQD